MDEVRQENPTNTGKVEMNAYEYKKLMKKYKKTKRYMKSNLFAVKTMDGTEKFVSGLIKEAEQIASETRDT
tara:strand:- start:1366 stop:1578 length:213 start_codon:yes stop_codon:yes gene_type:complete